MKKTCTKCGIEKEVSEFHKHPRGKYGVSSLCRSCQSVKNAEKWAARKAAIKNKPITPDRWNNLLTKKWVDLRGAAPDITGGMLSEEFVAKQRDS